MLSISECTIIIKLKFIYLTNSRNCFLNKLHYFVCDFPKLFDQIRCVLRSLKVNNTCKIAPSSTSESCLPTCVCYFIAAIIIIVITTNGTFHICGITSHKTSALIRILIRRKIQTNGRHILNDKKIEWQKTNWAVFVTFR